MKEKYITENAFLSHGTNDIEEEEYNSSDCSLQAEISASHSSDNTSEKGYSHHPNILRLFPAENVTEPIPF
ncbi:hypothetical protein CEXT_471081 [Caerostris extrusa]|uniref:Uncharacterized protein n=1 Tax=Caerostris extrusa TaxID=172846 RepID=A0AAV4PYS7_CAEEX|nr:hypothetical protein CEXT_471081 [Caerostris extrusa]